MGIRLFEGQAGKEEVVEKPQSRLALRPFVVQAAGTYTPPLPKDDEKESS